MACQGRLPSQCRVGNIETEMETEKLMFIKAGILADSLPRTRILACIGLVLLLSLTLVGAIQETFAQETGQVQELTGSLGPVEFRYYLLPDLKQGQILYVYMEGTSGNLDPAAGLLSADQDAVAVEEMLQSAAQNALLEGRDPLEAIKEAGNQNLLIWDDDGGGGLSSAFAYQVQVDDDYGLAVTSALSALEEGTFGDYRLLVGIDAPEVLTGKAMPTGEILAVLDREASPLSEEVQEITGTLTLNQMSEIFELYDLRGGDTLYAFVEATSGDLRPSLTLRNFANKATRTSNLAGSEAVATLEHQFNQDARNNKLEIAACCEGQVSEGDYHLLVGVNAPEVLTGQAEPTDQPVVERAVPVKIGIQLQQIVEVDEQNEFFTAVANLQMEWTDPRLAFSPESCDCTAKTYTGNTFNQFARDVEGRWPGFTLYNQQGNRWSQNRVAVVDQNGHVIYFERFSTDLQVDFDFRRYPFDQQTFDIRVDSIYPENFYYFTDLEGYSGISGEHGEDEFLIKDFDTTVTSQPAGTRATVSRFTFQFEAPRHAIYYILQIFVPILLIISVSWVTFFLRDYGRRIEVASANMLVFIAFGFSLSDNYPRLGYLTFLDAVMVVTFVINALVVIYSVLLRRMEMNGQGEQAERIDSVLDWLYPFSYIVAGIVLYFLFF